jgi:colicin import membrane protein
MKTLAHLLSVASLALAMMAFPLPALAQAPEDKQLAAEQARISAEREQAEATFRQEEKACYGKFAVNDCLQAARKKRREVDAALRRQEVSLNDASRRRKAAERLRDIEERAATPPQPRPQVVQPHSSRAAESAAKEVSRQEQAAGRQQRSREKQARKAAGIEEKNSAVTLNQQRREARLQQAAERRAKMEKRLADRKKPPAQPLPVEP